jgi:putative endonuclease
MSTANRDSGLKGEEIACGLLRREGYLILERNYRYARAEVDIIARDGETIVFCEVKYRTTEEFGTPEEAVTLRKRRQIRKAALGYTARRGFAEDPCRFDVIAIQRLDGRCEIRHWKDAF